MTRQLRALTFSATVIALMTLWPVGSAVRAHEIGTTHVSASFDAGRYRVEIVTDAAALVDKLEAAAGVAPAAVSSPADIRVRLQAFDRIFRQRLVLSFDGVAMDPQVEYFTTAPSDLMAPTLATVSLTGRIPAGARMLQWRYGWTFASYALIVRQATAQTTEWLEGGQLSKPVSLAAPLHTANRGETALRYLGLGFTHIVPYGIDHMLFVLGIFLLTRRTRAMLWQVSAFTVAHSITLGLSMYGVISLNPAVVEPLIALSIAYVAIENLFMSELKPSRIALVFAFGLLHGMGFAGALKELGLPRSEFVTALLTFNVGVEAGQLAVIAAAFLAVGWYCGRQWYRRRVVIPASALIAAVAVFWTIQRTHF